MNFSDLRAANRMRQKEWPGNTEADTAFRAIEVAGEAGEVAEAVKKLLRDQRGIRGSKASVDDVADEIADTIIALDLLADNLGIELAPVIARKFNATSEKYGLATRLDLFSDDEDNDAATCDGCSKEIHRGDMCVHDTEEGIVICADCSFTWDEMLAEPHLFLRRDDDGERVPHTAETAKEAADDHVAAGGSLTDKIGLRPY